MSCRPYINPSTTALPARTRLYISMAVCTIGAVGLTVSNRLEKMLPPAAPRSHSDISNTPTT
ncbi:hypothetical protein ID866_3616 [Astraeus odoratus]|nr:hypothetical protein ID866_3616 [Astraeus odoratus]